jgi:predicted peptidase
MKVHYLFLGICILMQMGPEIHGQEDALVPGYQEHAMDMDDGTILNYTVWDPRLSSSEPVPLILALHYGGNRFPFIGREFLELLAVPAFIELGAFMVAPDCPGTDWTDARSTRAVRFLLDSIFEKYYIDRDRVVVFGFSMGGIGAWHMAASFPELFSAGIAVAGKPPANIVFDVPVYALHSRNDEVIDPDPARSAIKQMKKQGIKSKFVIFDGPTHYQTIQFAEPLSAATWWLESVWRQQMRSRSKR